MRAKEEIAVALILALFGAAYYFAAGEYALGKMANPGPGVLPRGLGLVFVALSLYLAGAGVLALKTKRREAAAASTGPKGAARAPLGVTLILILYVLLLPVLGFSIATFLAVFCASRLLGLEGWAKPFSLAIATTALCFLVFGWLLDVPLPAGMMWEGS